MKQSVFLFSLLVILFIDNSSSLRQELLIDIYLIVVKNYLLYTLLPLWEKMLR